MHQLSFSSSEHAMKKRVTRREKFLGEMERVVPWVRLVAVIEPVYPRSGRVGRPPIGVERMLRMKLRAAMAGYILRKWSVDCSPDHCLRGPEYRLWLKDHLAIYGVKNAVLAPGYSATTKADS